MNATGDRPDDLVRRIRSDVSSWTPRRGPRWAALEDDARQRPVQIFRLYALAGAALVVILVGAFLAMSALNVGSFAGQPVVSSTQAR